MKSLIISAAASLAALAAAPALAETEPQTFVFRINAETLQTDADVRAAYQRLVQEALRYCRALDLGPTREQAVCRMDVVGHVVEAVGDDRLIAAHQAATRERQLASAG